MTLFQRLIAENIQERDRLQKELLIKIQNHSGRKTLVYLANFKSSPYNMISEEDKSPVDMLINSLPSETKAIDFILHSPGGFAESVEMIVIMLRKNFDHIRFIIPHSAMSAATMFALSGDEILMFQRSQLGPIDPQISGPTSGPAQSIIDGFDEIKKEVEKSGKLNGAFVPILNKMDVSTIKYCREALSYGKRNVKKWLQQYMFKNLPTEKAKKEANKASNFFSNRAIHLTHRRPIMKDEAEAQGLNIKNIEKDKDFSELIKEYYYRYELVLDASPAIAKIFHSESELIVKNAPIVSVSPVRFPLPPQKK